SVTTRDGLTVQSLRLCQYMTGKRATMPVLRGAIGLDGAHDVPAHPSASAVRARWARQRAITASAKLAVPRSRSGNWAIMLSRSDRRGAREPVDLTNVRTASVVRLADISSHRRCSAGQSRASFAPRSAGRG